MWVDWQWDGGRKGDCVSVLSISSSGQRSSDDVTRSITDQYEKVVSRTSCTEKWLISNTDHKWLRLQCSLSYPELTGAGRAHKLHLEGQLDVIDADGASTGLQMVRLGVRLSSSSALSQSTDLSQQSWVLLTCITDRVTWLFMSTGKTLAAPQTYLVYGLCHEDFWTTLLRNKLALKCFLTFKGWQNEVKCDPHVHTNSSVCKSLKFGMWEIWPRVKML